MEKIIKQGRLLFGIAITTFGVQNLIWARFGLAVRGVPWFSRRRWGCRRRAGKSRRSVSIHFR